MLKFNVKTWLDTKGVKSAVKQASIQPLHKAALLVERDAKVSMKTGGGRKKEPSEVGTPPNVQTSNLRGSIQNAPTLRGTYLVGPTLMAWYGRIHEIDPGKRKFMKPALDRQVSKFPYLFKNMPLGRTIAGQHLNSRRFP